MKIKNDSGIPEAIVRAARRDSYSRGDSRISVTQLISPPRINILRGKHHADMEVDITSRIWALLGSAVHYILEKGASDEHIPEERLYVDVGGWRVSGAVDVHYGTDLNVGIIDYKVTSCYSVMHDKPEWEQQLNLYAALVRKSKGINPDKLQICAILRDWKESDLIKSNYSDKEYPKKPIVMVNISVWSDVKQDAFLADCVRVHQEAFRASEWGEELPECTSSDRWERDEKWAVMKPGAKRSLRTFNTQKEAEEFLSGQGTTVDDTLIIDHRPGIPIRCARDYCGVAEWCSQYKAIVASGDQAAGIAEVK